MPETIKTVVVERDDAIDRAMTATTPADQANIKVQTITMLQSIGIRAARTFAKALLGMLGADGVGVATGDFKTWALLALCAAVTSAGWDLVELLNRLDERMPKWRA
jgi:hypothetical protein